MARQSSFVPARVVHLALDSVGRAVASFHPVAFPRLSRASYRRELAAWSFLSLMLGVVEGGVAGVLAKHIFTGSVAPSILNLAVAILSGAPALANVMSFLWAALSHGRHKIRFLVTLQVLAACCVLLLAVAPRDALGLVMLVGGVLGTRMCWSGVVTLRTTVWRANYPRTARASLAGKLATAQAIVMIGASLAIGAAVKVHEDAFRLVYPVAAAVGLIGAWTYSGMRMRGHRALRQAERRGEASARSLVSPQQFRRLLLTDAPFRRYMSWMFVFGVGNQMVIAPLVVMLKDRLHLDPLLSVLIAATIPLVLMPLSIPFWSPLLDRVHIVRFRAIHSWAFVGSITAILLGMLTMQLWLLFLGAVLKGVAFGGGVLGWNLGHHDFAPVEKASQYMGVHVTLTGVRGLVAPLIAISLYEVLEHVAPGAGPWVFAACLALSLTGALGFTVMARSMGSHGERVEDAEEA